MFEETLWRFVKGQVEAEKTRRFHAFDNAKARAAYKAMVTQDPARNLSPAEQKQIIEYSKDVFGSPKLCPMVRGL